MENNVMEYYEKIELGREPFKGEDWFGYLLTIAMEVIQDTELTQLETKDLLHAISNEM